MSVELCCFFCKCPQVSVASVFEAHDRTVQAVVAHCFNGKDSEKAQDSIGTKLGAKHAKFI